MVDKALLNAFEVLGIEPTASKEEIKKAYKVMAKKYHPDLVREPKLKKDAEERFKMIQSCYEYLMEINIEGESFDYQTNEHFTEFFNAQNDVEDDYDDFVRQKTDFDSLLKRAIKFVEDELKKAGLSTLDAYQKISAGKHIFHWDTNAYETHTINDYLIKENLYRRHVLESDEYLAYLQNKKFYDNLNIHAVLICGDKYKKKQFFEKVSVHYQSICKKCHGKGCSKCVDGIVESTKDVTVKVPITDHKKFYEIKNGGHESQFGHGSLILTVVKKHKEVDYQFKQRSRLASAFNPLLDAYDFSIDKVMALFQLMKKNTHYTVLYFIIVCLLITIICLAVLL